MSSKKHGLKREMEKLGRARGCWGGQRLGQSQRGLGWVLQGQRGVSPGPGPGRSRGSTLSPGGLCSPGTSPGEDRVPILVVILAWLGRATAGLIQGWG